MLHWTGRACGFGGKLAPMVATLPHAAMCELVARPHVAEIREPHLTGLGARRSGLGGCPLG